MALATVDRQLDLTTDHQLGQVVLVRLTGDAAADHLAPPDDGDAVGDLEDLVQLVADEDDAVPLGRQPAQDREDLDRLAKGMIEYETITAEEAKKIIAGEKLDRDDDNNRPGPPPRSTLPKSGKPRQSKPKPELDEGPAPTPAE